MKKKFLSFIIAFAFIISTAIGLTACGGNDPDLMGIGIVYNNEEHKDNGSYYIGSFEKGTNINLNYKVKAYYSDNTSKELTSSQYQVKYYKSVDNNEVEISSLSQPLDIAYYKIKISYESLAYSLDFNVEKASRLYQLQVSGSREIYYGQSKPTISVVGAANIDSEDINYICVPTNQPESATAPTEEELNGQTWDYISSESFAPGSYFLYATVAEQEECKAGRTNFVRFTVKKGQLEFTNPEEKLTSLTFTYSGNLSGDVNVDILNNELGSVELYNKHNQSAKVDGNIRVVKSSDQDVLNYNTYNTGVQRTLAVEILQSSEYYEAITWTCTVTVQKGTIVKPTLQDGTEFIYLDTGDIDTWWDHIHIVRDDQTIPTNGEYTKQLTLNDTLTEPGTYTYTLSLVDSDSYTWADGTTDPINLVYTKTDGTNV